MGEKNLTNLLLDLFIAGSETTSTTLNWAMLYMVLNPDIQKKVQIFESNPTSLQCNNVTISNVRLFIF